MHRVEFEDEEENEDGDGDQKTFRAHIESEKLAEIRVIYSGQQ